VRINLRSVDMNLLVMFDALIAERHVTRAAARAAMSQPAMSNALSRLRTLFKDELFVRTSKGMEPTARALELGESVRQILMQTERLVFSDTGFDPRTSDRRFTLRMSDLVGYLLLPRLLHRLAEEAPGVSLNVLHIAPDRTVRALEEDLLDFAVSFDLAHARSICALPLFTDRMVVAMREEHPFARGRMTMSRFMQARHLRVAMSPTDLRFVDSLLAAKGLSRQIALSAPQWLLVPALLAETELLGVVSERIGRRLSVQHIVCKPLPFESPSFEWTIYWQRRHERSDAHQWLKASITAVAKELYG
jgi:DNA-binding transcriptional LysR family regulator